MRSGAPGAPGPGGIQTQIHRPPTERKFIMKTRTTSRTGANAAATPTAQPSSAGGPNGQAPQSSKSSSRFSRSFPGVPQSIIDAHENVILYEPDEGRFFVYDPATGLYVEESTDLIRTKIGDRIRLASSR